MSACGRQPQTNRPSFPAPPSLHLLLQQVLEARSELDSLDALASCPLLAAHPQRYHPFLQGAPLLLAPATDVGSFGARLHALLAGGEGPAGVTAAADLAAP